MTPKSQLPIHSAQVEEADDLLRSCYERIREKLSAHRESLDRLTEALVDHQELTGEQVREIVG